MHLTTETCGRRETEAKVKTFKTISIKTKTDKTKIILTSFKIYYIILLKLFYYFFQYTSSVTLVSSLAFKVSKLT